MAFSATYLDFLAATREDKMTSPNSIINEAGNHQFVLTEMLRGKDSESITKGGTALVDFIRVATNGSFQVYNPGDNLTPVSADTTKKISLAWKHMQCNYGYLDEEVLLNENDPSHFFNLKEKYTGDAVLDFVYGLESNILWAVPNNASMEASGGIQPYSIPCFVNELTNTVPTGFTTVMTLNPATTTQWQNQRSGYTMSKATDPQDPAGLAAALDNCLENVKFEVIPFGPAKNFQENANGSRRMIATTLAGRTMYKAIIRASNDRTASPQDLALDGATYAGYKLKRVDALETAALYASGCLAASHTAGVAKDTAPRFYFLDLDYIYPIFNKDRFFDEQKPESGGINKPNFHAVYYFTMGQIWCASRKRQGIVYPSAA